MNNEIDIIKEIRKEGEGFLKELNEEFYRNLSGLKKESNIGAIYEAHPLLEGRPLGFPLP